MADAIEFDSSVEAQMRLHDQREAMTFRVKVRALMAAEGISEQEAGSRVARADPACYQEYRRTFKRT